MFISPFEPIVWLVIVLVALVIVFGIHQAFTMENKSVVQNHLDEIGNDCSYSNCIIIVFGYLFQQGIYVVRHLLRLEFFIVKKDLYQWHNLKKTCMTDSYFNQRNLK